MPASIADAQPVKSELEWKNGNGAYTDVAGPSSVIVRDVRAGTAWRPWVHRTAFGSPVEPEVKMSRKRSSS